MSRKLRILHFSDIHIDIQIRHMHWKKWFSKRAIGAINLLRGRSKYFDDAEIKMEAMVRFKEEQQIDYVVNTGDYTALGLEKELAIARELMDPMMVPPQHYITVPGNHDIYVHEGNSHYRFSEQFCSVLQNDLPEYCRGGHWPMVRLVGEHAAFIALNSARPNLQPWKSDGTIPDEQLESFSELLADPRLEGRFLFVVTHYAPRLANGHNDSKLHGLNNVEAFLQACKPIQSGAILCGHIHKTYRVHAKGVKSEIFCAGSATMEGHEGAWLYELDEEGRLEATKIGWRDEGYYLKV
jgi:3',5'-cyclic AMP phosphodiesterase CpdA